MAIKRKGNLTKEKILHFAKDAFYQNGYHATQLKSIAALADLSLGNLNYYFKKKDDLVEEIYRQFFTDIYHFIKKSAVIDPLEQFCLFQFMVYTIVLTDEHNKRFYCEIIQDKSNYRVMHGLMREKYHEMLDALGHSPEHLDFEIILLAEFGTRREIFLNFFAGDLHLTLDQLVYYLIRNTCKNLEVPPSVFENLMTFSHHFIAEKDFSHLKFLA